MNGNSKRRFKKKKESEKEKKEEFSRILSHVLNGDPKWMVLPLHPE